VIHILVFGFTLWFGLYLLARDPRKPALRYAGLGLAAYALAIALDLLASYEPALGRWRLMVALLPSAFWFGVSLSLLPDAPAFARRYLPWLVVAYVLLTGLAGAPAVIIAAVPIIVSAVALGLVWRAFRSGLPQRPLAALLTATIFFLLALGLLVIPLEWLPSSLVLLAISGDLAVLGYAIAALDAFDEGEALLPDCLRSLGFAAFAALLFGGQVAVAMFINGVTFEMLALLLAVVATAIATQTFADPIQSALDRLIFARFPRLRQARADLRAAASALPRINEALNLETMDEAEFVRLTRRALGHMGDLQRLAANPLTRLPVIEARLAARGEQDNTLERAAELKALLAESIARLKPRTGENFGTSDEWRYYNALYFPYVAGLKPYSRRSAYDNGLDPIEQAALDWFQAYVPERTLHNWQNAAARLVAQDLRERRYPL
jgi:hypothetical protein